MNEELVRIENEIYSEYISDTETSGSIKTSIKESMVDLDLEFLKLKNNLKERLFKKNVNYYIDDIHFEYIIYSKDYIRKLHKFDSILIIIFIVTMY
jgi:hypothetical protein